MSGRGQPDRCHVLVERTANTHPPSPNAEILGFARCRNEILRLPAFFEHYRRLGVDRFYIVDNDSTDGSSDYLAAQPDVHLFHTARRYGEASLGVDWLNALLAEFGGGSWCVTVDIDELLAYPGSEVAPLRTLTKHLDQSGYQALACLLLDLYPAGPLKDARYRSGGDVIAAAPYFDAGPYERLAVDLCPGVVIRGGMRARIFYPRYMARNALVRSYDALLDRLGHHVPALRQVGPLRARRRRNPPCLTKVPLVRWDRQSRYVNSIHWIAAQPVAPESGVLLHFKFLHDFHDRAAREATRGEYYDEASEYRTYIQRLNENPDMSLVYEGSRRFEGTAQLVALGLMRDSARWAEARQRAHE